MRYVIEPLRRESIRMTYYLDDICLLAKSEEEMKTVNSKVLKHLEDLGLPIQHQEDVNYRAARKDQQTDQEGETSSEGRLQLQLQVDSKSIGEDDFHVTSDSRRLVTYPTHTKGSIVHIAEQTSELGVDMPIIPCEQNGTGLVVAMDASDLGWGVASKELETTGFWTESEKATSINTRELQAIYFGLKLHAQKYKGPTIKLQLYYKIWR
ncbi:hypothetical protein G6F37_013542 [Rhizopus arrhizus]|nr:hypothetical protein G6F37_013542 [Rhizopus arrhizus]